MNFLAPLFLIGAVGLALPVLFHLVRRSTRQRTPFGSLLLLRPVPPRLTQRNRLEHLLLLLLRCAALALLAAGFARPFLRQVLPTDPAAPGEAQRRVLLIDTSASMRRPDLWAAARGRVEALVRDAHPADQVAIFTFDRAWQPVLTFEEWSAATPDARIALVRDRLAPLSPGWQATHLDQALLRGADLASDTADRQLSGPREVVVVSDLQEGSYLNALQNLEWPKEVRLRLETVKPSAPGNAGVQLLPEVEALSGQAAPSVRVRVSNSADAREERFQLAWASPQGPLPGPPVEAHVPAGQSRVLALTAPAPGTGADRVVLLGDGQPFDNTVFTLPPDPVRLVVHYTGAEAEDDAREPFFFLRRAFQTTRNQAVEVVRSTPATSPPSAELETAALLVVSGALPDARARALHEAVAAGKTLLYVITAPEAGTTLATLAGSGPLRLGEGRSKDYGILAELEFRHPVFAPFAEARYSDFSRIHYWKHRQLEVAELPNARVLARLDNHDPWLVECPVGRGRLLILTSGWHPSDSQFALSSKFVPWLHAVLDLSQRTRVVAPRLLVGDAVPVSAEMRAAAAAVLLERPEGAPVPLPTEATAFTQTLTPGVYRLLHALGTNRFVVNLDPAESRTTALAPDDLETLGAPVEQATADKPVPSTILRDAELEGRQKLWRWCLLTVIGLLALEGWLAGRTTRAPRAETA